MPKEDQEFQTSREADDMLRGLNKASRYCRGENSSRQHNERVRQVEAERDRLRQEGK